MTVKTIFYHGADYTDRITVALDIVEGINLELLEKTASLFPMSELQDGQGATPLNVGVAYVNPRDQYSRSKGREVSVAKQKQVSFFLAFVEIRYSMTSFELKSKSAPVEMAMVGKLDDGKVLVLKVGFKNNFMFISSAYLDEEENWPQVFPKSADKEVVTNKEV